MRVNRFGLFIVVLLLSGCVASSLPYMRGQIAQRIAAPAWMIKRDIAAFPYVLRSYERIHDQGGIVNIYIEGDALEFTDSNKWNIDPTPVNPVALHLASKDRSDNVIYIARPCQYNDKLLSGQICDDVSWKDARFSREVILSFNAAFDDIAQRYNVSGFNIIGYSGGGVVAMLLAKERSDILSIRTIAAPLDHDAQSIVVDRPYLSRSLNPKDFVSELVDVPQYHFLGGQDRYSPPSVLHSYMQSVPSKRCINVMLIQEVSHDRGWVNKWPELLGLLLTCNGELEIDYNIDEEQPLSEPVFIVREKPAKP